MKTWLVTGSSRGLGTAFVRHALARGDNVVATARRPEVVTATLGASPRLLATRLDVTVQTEAHAAVAQALERFGRLDVVVNNAGYGMVGAVEEVSDAEARHVFDTNFFGVLNVLRAVLPVLRHQRSGQIVNVGSVSGLRGAAGVGLYSATKHALEGLTEAVRREVAPLGIGVMVVEPGTIRTDFLAGESIGIAEARIADYDDGPLAGVRAFVERSHRRQLGDPDKMVALIAEALEADELPVRLPLGADAIEQLDAKLAAVADGLAPWRERALATGHEDGGATLVRSS